MPPLSMPARVLAFARRIGGFIVPANVPEPPRVVRDVPGAYALFMDDSEQDVIYAMSWPHLGVPIDERTNRSDWIIDGQTFCASRRDAQGNWIFRRCAR